MNKPLVRRNSDLAPFSARCVASLDEVFNELFDAFWAEPSFTLSRNYRPTNIVEDKDSFNIEINLAGFKKDQVQVTKQGNVLKVIAHKDENNQYVRSWQNSDWDVQKATVKMEDGLLKIVVPKTEVAKEQVIDIT